MVNFDKGVFAYHYSLSARLYGVMILKNDAVLLYDNILPNDTTRISRINRNYFGRYFLACRYFALSFSSIC